ncbi:MAG: helix-turn-helix domain-containing protein [Mycoplasma sp.]|nr:helix-turn-helix domain-containing protein [Mycoplasma sp.]
MIYPLKTIAKVLEYLKTHTYSETAKHFGIPIGTISTWKHNSKKEPRLRKKYSIQDEIALWKELKKKTREWIKQQRKLNRQQKLK